MTSPESSAIGRIIFWQRVRSFHQSPLLEALVELGIEVHFVGELQLQTDSHSHDLRSTRGLHCHEIPLNESDGVRLLESLHQATALTVSVFSNPHNDPFYKRLWRHCAASRMHFAFHQAAPGAHSGLLGTLARKIWYSLKAPMISRRILCILCNGGICREFLLSTGFRPDLLVNWGYFTVDPVPPTGTDSRLEGGDPAAGDCLPHIDHGRFPFVYVGRLVPCKRVDLLIRAIARLQGQGMRCSLAIVGDGPLKDELMAMARSCGANECITFLGQRPQSSIQAIMRRYGCLVLSSVREEWGAVVNEALACGTPVICSDACGARDLLNTGAGLIFDSGSLDSLVHCMAAIQSDESSRKRMREAALSTAEKCSPRVAAAYLVYALGQRLRGSPARKPPWLADAGSGGLVRAP